MSFNIDPKTSPPALPDPPTPLRDLLLSTGAMAALSGFFLWAAYKIFEFCRMVVQDEAIRGWAPRTHRENDTDFIRGVLPVLAGLFLFLGAVLLITLCRTIYRRIRHQPLVQDHDFDDIPFDQTDYNSTRGDPNP